MRNCGHVPFIFYFLVKIFFLTSLCQKLSLIEKDQDSHPCKIIDEIIVPFTIIYSILDLMPEGETIVNWTLAAGGCGKPNDGKSCSSSRNSSWKLVWWNCKLSLEAVRHVAHTTGGSKKEQRINHKLHMVCLLATHREKSYKASLRPVQVTARVICIWDWAHCEYTYSGVRVTLRAGG